jgi:2-polyprenyl-6-methoxyphenol hydroxylase-like FAD-dependent oxidoreductase
MLPVQAHAELSLSDGSDLSARLVVAADGRNSRLRAASQIRTRAWSYPQAALTTILAHDCDHGGASTEFHTRQGPVHARAPARPPLEPGLGDGPQHAKRLMALDDPALGLAIERQAHSMLGKMRIDGPRGLVPMSGLSVERYQAERLALVGEAAHVFPPIGAQGLNLGLRDVAALRDAVVDAREAGEDIGGAEALARYQRSRRSRRAPADRGGRRAQPDAPRRLSARRLPARPRADCAVRHRAAAPGGDAGRRRALPRRAEAHATARGRARKSPAPDRPGRG